MKTMVFNVAAQSGGALTILEEFYQKFKADIDNEYIFVVSKTNILASDNITVLSFPWVKRSWFHRIYFDYWVSPRLVRRYGVNRVLSLQNLVIPSVSVPQSVYIHNALPLSEHRFSIFESRILWTYQNIIGKGILKSAKKAEKVIVQANWIKNELIDKLSIEENKIQVIPPVANILVKKKFARTEESVAIFFYPANGAIFKNHQIIVDACLDLKQMGITNYRVIFTLSGNENKHISRLKEVSQNTIPVEFVGTLSREAVFDYYSKSILIFPSFIETVGLPLIEAKVHGTPILASDCSFSREFLGDYDYAWYFDPFDNLELVKLMLRMLEEIGQPRFSDT